MPGKSWNEILAQVGQVGQAGSPYDHVRRQYLQQFHAHTQRNVITYYSGWLQKPHLTRESSVAVGIHDGDRTGFMSVIKGLDTNLGLDLVLHTPGGDMAATESLVNYLRAKFGKDIRAFIPELAMSGGTMIACACKEIWMGKQSSIGPIDPQFGNISAVGVLQEFERAAAEIKRDNTRSFVWQPILRQIEPAFLTECSHAIDWAKKMAHNWLETNMFSALPNKKQRGQRARKVVTQLTKKITTMTHGRHINFDEAHAMGLNVIALGKL